MGYRQWDFDIDKFINPVLPPPPWRHLPYPVARWFGYRKDKPAPVGNLVAAFWAFLGVFCAITIIEAVSTRIPGFIANHAPMIIGSLVCNRSTLATTESRANHAKQGATAVLEFYAIEAPLAQPRNCVLGQLLACVVGVAVAKIFQHSDRFEEIQFLGGAFACASTVALMGLTKTVHPPAGATALLAVIDDRLVQTGWFLIPTMLLGVCIMLAVAMIFNNIERRFPVYWWTPAELGKKPEPEPQVKAEAGEMKTNGTENGAANGVPKPQEPNGAAAVEHKQHDSSEAVIKPGVVVLPKDVQLTPEEKELLEKLSRRL